MQGDTAWADPGKSRLGLGTAWAEALRRGAGLASVRGVMGAAARGAGREREAMSEADGAPRPRRAAASPLSRVCEQMSGGFQLTF